MCIRVARQWPYSFVLAFLAGTTGLATCETPSVTDFKVFCPYKGVLANKSSCMGNEMEDQGYPSPTVIEAEPSTSSTPGSCTVPGFKSILEAGPNFWITSHGSANGVAVEAYVDRDDAWTRYYELIDDEGQYDYDPSYLYVASASGYWHVSVSEAGIAAWSTGQRAQMMFLGYCDSAEHFGEYQGGLELGYDGGSTGADDEHNATILFQNMSGRRNNGERRCSNDALAETDGGQTVYTSNFRSSGTNIHLCPAVKQWGPPEMPMQEQGFVVFDVYMDKTADPADIISVTGDAHITGDPEWNEAGDTITFSLVGDRVGTATVSVDPTYCVSDFNKTHLDGGTPEENGIAPKEDAFVYSFDVMMDQRMLETLAEEESE